MSIKLMSQIWESGPENQSERFVLLALADYANDAGECWPSMAGIGSKVCMSERGVQKIVRRLEADGWLSVDVCGGRNGCNVYTITPEPRSPRTTFTPNEDAKHPEPRSPEPSLTVNKTIKGEKQVDRFDEFWNVYPHRGGVKRKRKDAEKKYALAVKRGTSEQTLIDAAKLYATEKTVRDGYARDPVTWLNQEGWADEVQAYSKPNGYDPQIDRWNYIAKNGTSEGWRPQP